MREVRTARYDEELALEAYRFEGYRQEFPNHFHDYYVIGFIERGERRMVCRNRAYEIGPDDIILLNPGDAHTCEPLNGSPFDYGCLNIAPEIMEKAIYELTGSKVQTHFLSPVLRSAELKNSLRELHSLVMEEEKDFVKEELFLLTLEQLLRSCTDIAGPAPPSVASEKIRAACAYIDIHFAEKIALDKLATLCGLGKYQLLKLFAREKGITPYRYLEAVRIGNAKKMLESGASQLDTACRTGFSDQSHFSRFFRRMIGLTPGQYLGIFGKTNMEEKE